jgi:hypothetical protein
MALYDFIPDESKKEKIRNALAENNIISDLEIEIETRNK